jgi:hypothetical protein
MDSFVWAVLQFVATYKWWLVACAPILIILIVLRMLSPR